MQLASKAKANQNEKDLGERNVKKQSDWSYLFLCFWHTGDERGRSTQWVHCHLCSKMPISSKPYLFAGRELDKLSHSKSPCISSQLSHLCKLQGLVQQCWEKIYIYGAGEGLLPSFSLNCTSVGSSGEGNWDWFSQALHFPLKHHA